MLRWAFPLLGACALLGLLAAPVAAQAQTPLGKSYYELGEISNGGLDGTYQVGYLTWNGGKGAISWDSEATTVDPGGYPSLADVPVRQVNSWLGFTMYTHNGEKQWKDRATIIDFVSDPVPRTLYLNTSRKIHFDLYAQVCAAIEVEMYVDNTFLAGGVHGWATYFVGPGYKPKAAPGYCSLLYRMPPEMDVIPQGSRITLRLVHAYDGPGQIAGGTTQAGQPGSPYAYGLKAPHRSLLYFFEYPPEELPFRRPAPSPVDAGSPSSGGGGALVVAPMLGLLALPSRKRRGAALAVMFLVAAAAGCVKPEAAAPEGGSTPPPSGTLSYEVRPTEAPPGGVAPSTGSLAGRIRDEFGYPVGNAHVTLVGSSNFTSSDSKGQFAMNAVPAGAYTVRVDKEKFASLEEPVKIVPGAVTVVEITLAPVSRENPNLLPHYHDYWAGLDKVTLLDAAIPITPQVNGAWFCTNSPTTYLLLVYLFVTSSESSFCVLPVSIPLQRDDPILVKPGTRELEVTVSWSAKAQEAIGVGFSATNYASTASYPNISLMYPRPSGVPVHLQTGWEMNDVGHQHATSWNFFLYVPNYDGSGDGTKLIGVLPELRAQTFQGPIRVKIVAHRGTVPLEPPHTDHWGTDIVKPLCKRGATEFTYLNEQNQMSSAILHPNQIVPPGATWIEVVATKISGTAPALELRYRTAADAGRDGPPDKVAPAPKIEGAKHTFRIPVEPTDTDSYYTKKSHYRFQFVAKGNLAEAAADYATSATSTGYSVSLECFVHRDARPA